MTATAELRPPVRQGHPLTGLQRRITDNVPPFINDLLALREQAKNLANGPIAYRSRFFINWSQDARVFFESAHRYGFSPRYQDRFQQRSFGRSANVLTESQIFAQFQQDMMDTIADLRHMFVGYQKRAQQDRNNIVHMPTAALSEQNDVPRAPMLVGLGVAMVLLLSLVIVALL